MPKQKLILRNFLYLDETTVDQFLSQLENGLIDGPMTVKDTNSKEASGSAGANLYAFRGQGQITSDASSETERTIRFTPESKFSHLYNLLRDNEYIQPLTGFDEATYQQIEVGEVVEVRGNGRLPQWENLKRTISDMSGLLEIMQLAGQDPFEDENARLGYEAVTRLSSMQGQESTLVMVTPLNAPKFTIAARLDPDGVMRKKEDLEAEITLLGKVQRVLRPGDLPLQVFRLLPELSTLMNSPEGNRAARRASGKRKGSASDTSSPWDEIIKYPAIQVQPIAIYQ